MTLPKKRQDLLNDLKKYLQIDDEDAVSDLLKNRDPMAIRDEMSTALGQHILQNYDKPVNAFKDSHILSEVPIEYTNLPENIAGKYNLSKNKILLPKENPELIERQTGTLMHELGHAKDWLIDKIKGSNLNESNSALKGSGLEAAEKIFGNHHSNGFFEKEALQKLLKGGKLAIPALALGSTLYSAGSKASEGDIPGAALKVGSAIDPTGTVNAVDQVKERLQMPTEEGVAASMQDIDNNAHNQLMDYSDNNYSEPDNTLKLLKSKLYGK